MEFDLSYSFTDKQNVNNKHNHSKLSILLPLLIDNTRHNNNKLKINSLTDDFTLNEDEEKSNIDVDFMNFCNFLTSKIEK